MERVGLVLVALALCGLGHAAQQRPARTLWRAVPAFAEAAVANSLSFDALSRSQLGEISLPAIFLHPQNRDRSLLTYPALTLRVDPGQRAFLLSAFGIRTGFDWNDPQRRPDGVRFYVMDGDRDLLSYHLRESRWVAAGVPLGASGGELRLTPALATDPGPAGNSNFDWALFGDPMVVLLDEAPVPPATAVGGVVGILVVQLPEGGAKAIVEGLDAAGQPVPGAVAESLPCATGLTFARFDFSDHTACVAWQWRLEGEGEAPAWGGSWQPELAIEAVGLSRAVVFSGQEREGRITVRNTGPGALLPEHQAHVEMAGIARPLPHLAPGDTVTLGYKLPPAQGPSERLPVAIRWQGGAVRSAAELRSHTWPTLPALPEARPTQPEARDLGAYILLQNPHVRWLICREAPGLGALVYCWTDRGWELAGSVTPWVELVLPQRGEHLPALALLSADTGPDDARLQATLVDDGGLICRLRAILPLDDIALRLDLTVSSRHEAQVLAVRGPAVHAGDGGTGADKGVAIFPGLEYLEDEEPSSSTRDLAMPHADRRVPHKFKVTVPMMMVETRRGGPVVAVAWDAKQKWDGEHLAPAACFASPDFITNKDSHLMQLLLPAVPEGLPENARQAQEPLSITPHRPWRLKQRIAVGLPQPDATAALRWFDDWVGYPEAEAPPRSFAEEMALCRHAWLVTCWDEETQKGRHCVGWAPANSPGHATLMLMDARAVATGEAKQQLLERVDLVGHQTIEQEGPGGLASGANCHIMGWEFPYHWGGLPGALVGMREQAEATMRSQEDNGGWGFYPSEDRQSLGTPGTQTMGTCAGPAYRLAKWAAISGDPAVTAAMRKALARLRAFRVPRGAQGWECPILQPDVLASAYALRAAVWAYQATGEAQYLEDARLYARTGLPFQYAWDDGEHPGMRYASIPVFGSTFFTHSWIGLPVQWCGLVYAYGLVELMRFDSDDLWRRQVEGMTASAMHQQWPLDNKDLAGSYPDSYGQWFTVRNGAYINPEDIQVNAMALRGLDPGLRSVAVQIGGRTVHVTAPGDLQTSTAGGRLTLRLKYLPGETCYLTLAGWDATAVPALTANGQPLTSQPDLPHGSTGWTLEPQSGLVVLGATCDAQGWLEVVALP